MKYVYAFEEGSKEQKFLLGGKGANLAEMTKLGLPVPPGFTITTEACNAYRAAGDSLPGGLMDEVEAALKALESKMGKQLGDPSDPLLVSVRSGAAVLDAGDDGHGPQPRAERRLRRRPRHPDRQRAVRVRLLPPVRADVRQDRARRRRRARSRRPSRTCATSAASRPTLSSPPTTCAVWSRRSRRS